ncbi:MAG TPA: hypothetical protein DDY37_06335 [Legionella sp.]|nr:hypothetical protein [Legionella sp.]
MAGNYRKKNATPRHGSRIGQLLLAAVFFIAGYLSAAVFDLTRLTSWLGMHVLAKTNTQLLLRTSAEPAPLPKPKFEFYTLLAKERVAGSVPAAPQPKAAQPVAVLPVKNPALPLHAPLAPVPAVDKLPAMVANNVNNASINTKDAYLVQVGSFKRLQEAERMKASLLMKGFDVKLSDMTQQGVHWYRITIGPFASRTQAQETLLSFARREHIVGMIRKMDA